MTDPSARLSAALEGRYSLERELGAGGMATVYLAHDVKHDRKVALKVLRPELAAVVGADRFLAEIRTTANLQHPHILPLFDSGEADGFLYFVMPYVEGESLRERLDREGELPVEEAVRIATAVGSALDYAHRRGVIHRDIKPANILLHDGQPLVADFGIALAVSAAGGGRLTETGLSLGTPYYMSPEQATGERDPDPRSDVYSLGCVLYEMLTGEPPFTGGSAQAVLGRILTTEPARLREVRPTTPAHVEAVVSRALQKRPADRFATAAELTAALANPAYAIAAAAPSVAPAGRRSSRLALAVPALLLGLAGLAAWGWLRPRPAPRVARLNVTVPVGQRYPEFPASAISPDGSRYVYGIGSQDFADQLYLREIGQTTAAPVVGSENAWYPFFSPDGAAIAFSPWGSTDIRIVPLDGGPVVVAARDAFAAGDWGEDGYIYYTRSGERGLSRIPAGGGAREDLTTQESSLWHDQPDLLPGGNALVFAIFDPAVPANSSIAALSLDTKTVTKLFPGVFVRYARSGHLLYLTHDGGLHAVPFDADRLAVTGSSFRLADRVAPRLGTFGVSDDGTLLYPVPRPGTASLVRVDRTGRRTSLPIEDAQYRTVTLSPDGRKAGAEISDPDAGSDDIWVIDLETGARQPITFGGEHEDVAWTPDGRRVLFSASLRDAGDIYWAAADGTSGEEPLLAEAAVQYEPAVSPDGRLLFWREGDVGDDDTDIFFAPIDSPGVRTALLDTPRKERSPAPSPDSRWIAYVSDETNDLEVYVRPFPSGPRTLISRGGGWEPRWARDTGELFYRNGQGMWVARLRQSASTITVDRQLLFPENRRFRQDASHPTYDVFPDGRSLLMIEKTEADYDLVVVLNFFEELRARAGR